MVCRHLQLGINTMTSQIKTCTLLLSSAFLLVACATTKVIDEPVGNKVKSISTYTSNGTVAPEYRRTMTVKLDSGLNLNKVVKDYKGQTTINENIKVTQAQFDSAVKEVEALDLSKLKSTPYRAPPGSSTRQLSVETGEGTYKFNPTYPPAINRLSGNVDKLVP